MAINKISSNKPDSVAGNSKQVNKVAVDTTTNSLLSNPVANKNNKKGKVRKIMGVAPSSSRFIPK